MSREMGSGIDAASLEGSEFDVVAQPERISKAEIVSVSRFKFPPRTYSVNLHLPATDSNW